MELSVDSHPGPSIYAYYFRPCYAELLDIGTSYPIRATIMATAFPSTTHLQAHRRHCCHVVTGDGSSSWNSPSSLHTPTAPDKAYDDHIKDTVTSRTNPGYSYRACDCCDSSSSRTTPVLSELGTQVVPKPPRLPYDDPRESVQSG
ncbi:UNVERIFIED_CONTAM: hypothetical protein Slati_3059500 [Sesamum latifolium]|uniref:Uncharacterized protein n=1 Tax=Sesamum latifolium TaxID=2727402 RepID=A0AAW2UT09_9LAMI